MVTSNRLAIGVYVYVCGGVHGMVWCGGWFTTIDATCPCLYLHSVVVVFNRRICGLLLWFQLALPALLSFPPWLLAPMRISFSGFLLT